MRPRAEGGIALIRVIRRSHILSWIEDVFSTSFTRGEVAELFARSVFERFQVKAGLLYAVAELRGVFLTFRAPSVS